MSRQTTSATTGAATNAQGKNSTAGQTWLAESRSLGLRYWIPTGLLCLIFLGSTVLTIVDRTGSDRAFLVLGFPAYFSFPLGLAKAAGVVAVLRRHYRTLALFAYAGFLYDLILALVAHIHEKDFPSGWLAVFGLSVWIAAFWADQRAFGSLSTPSSIKQTL